MLLRLALIGLIVCLAVFAVIVFIRPTLVPLQSPPTTPAPKTASSQPTAPQSVPRAEEAPARPTAPSVPRAEAEGRTAIIEAPARRTAPSVPRAEAEGRTAIIEAPAQPAAPASGPVAEAPAQPAATEHNTTDATERMAALQKAIEALPKGNIVLDAPSKMTVGDEREVKASVGVDVPIEKLREQSPPSDQQKEGSLYTSLEMVATLSGPGFTIAQTTPEKQTIAKGFPTVWTWNVTAKQEGERALEATLYVIIGDSRIRVESYTDTISVSVRPQTWAEWLKSLSDELGAVKSILVAIGGIVTLILGWLGYKRMSPSQKGS